MMHWCSRIHNLTMWILILQIKYQCIDTHQCINVYWSIQCSCICIKHFKMLEKKPCITMVTCKIYTWEDFIIVFRHSHGKCLIVLSSNVSWYHDTFGMMHWYSHTLHCPISRHKAWSPDGHNITWHTLSAKTIHTFLVKSAMAFIPV